MFQRRHSSLPLFTVQAVVAQRKLGLGVAQEGLNGGAMCCCMCTVLHKGYREHAMSIIYVVRALSILFYCMGQYMECSFCHLFVSPTLLY